MSTTRSRTTAFAVALLTALMVFAVPLVSPAPAHAQNTGSIELVAHSSWIDDGGIFNIQVRVAGAPSDSTVVVQIYEPWLQRDAFLRNDLENNSTVLLALEPVLLSDAQQTSNEVLGFEILIDGPNTRSAAAAAEQQAAELQAQLDAAAEAEGTPEDTNEAGEPLELEPELVVPEPVLPSLLTDGGSAVYPLEVSLLDADGEVIDSFLSSIIELPRRDLRPPLNVSIVFEPQSEVALLANGTAGLSTETLTNLSVLSTMVGRHPSANAALSISPETLLALDEVGTEFSDQIIEDLSTHLSSPQLLARPLTSLQEQAWIEAGLVDDLGELYEAGSDATREVLGIAPERSVTLLDPAVAGDSLDEILELGIQGVVVRPSQLPPLDIEVFPQALTTRFLLNIDETTFEEDEPDTVPALVADAGLGNHFINPGGQVLNANRLLADLVLLSLQESGGRHAVVVAPPASWQPNANFLNVLLGGIERVPVLEGVAPIDAMANTEITPSLGIGTLSGPLHRDLIAPIEATSLRSFRNEYSQARNAIDSWSTVIGDDNEARSQLDQFLYLSTDQRLADSERDQFIEAVFSEIDEQKDAAITTPESETITLTGREADVPIVLENGLGTEATVRLLLSSEELDFNDSAELLRTLQPGANRIEVPITARASGDSPIRIQVLSPDGLILLGSSEILVRTFAFSGLGIAIGGISIVVLLVWWVRHVRGARDTVDTLSEVIGV